VQSEVAQWCGKEASKRGGLPMKEEGGGGGGGEGHRGNKERGGRG
jgi:hypothetical protein